MSGSTTPLANGPDQVAQTQSSVRPEGPFNAPSQGAQSAPPAAVPSVMAIRYVQTAPVRVRGLITGRSYEFSTSEPVQSVDARDASSLLRTQFFRRA